MSKKVIKIATRGSQLALKQSNYVAELIESNLLNSQVELVVVKTEGDRRLDVPLHEIGGKALFVKEVEDALLAGKADLAVHSMKDMPSELHEDLYICAVPEMESPHDVFISDKYEYIEDMPTGKILGTSSPRRLVQATLVNSDVTIRSIRGNIDTRLQKLQSGQYDGIILAEAGLKRLGLDLEYRKLDLDSFIPSAGQGLLAVEGKKDNVIAEVIEEILHNDYNVRRTICERAFTGILGLGCHQPVGVYADLTDKPTLSVFISDPAGDNVFKETFVGGDELELASKAAETTYKKAEYFID